MYLNIYNEENSFNFLQVLTSILILDINKFQIFKNQKIYYKFGVHVFKMKATLYPAKRVLKIYFLSLRRGFTFHWVSHDNKRQ